MTHLKESTLKICFLFLVAARNICQVTHSSRCVQRLLKGDRLPDVFFLKQCGAAVIYLLLLLVVNAIIFLLWAHEKRKRRDCFSFGTPRKTKCNENKHSRWREIALKPAGYRGNGANRGGSKTPDAPLPKSTLLAAIKKKGKGCNIRSQHPIGLARKDVSSIFRHG